MQYIWRRCELRGIALAIAFVAPWTTSLAVNQPPGSKAYVSNSDSGTVSVVDLATGNVLDPPVTVGTEPLGSAVTPSRRFVYVANRLSNNVSVISTITDTVVATVALTGIEPCNLAVTPDGSRVYVVCKASDTVNVIETATNTETGSIPLPLVDGEIDAEPEGLAITPDGTKVYVVNRGQDAVSVITTATNTVTAGPILVGNAPRDARVSADGTKVIVVGDGAPAFIRTADDQRTASILADIGTQRDVDIAGNRAYVTNFLNIGFAGQVNPAKGPLKPVVSPSLDVYDVQNEQYLGSVLLSGDNPCGVAVSADGNCAWVAYEESNAFGFIDLVKLFEATKPVGVGSGPRGVSAFASTEAAFVDSYFLPRSLRVTLAGEGLDSLGASGFFDEGSADVDYLEPVTIEVGGFSRTFDLVPNASETAFVFKDEEVALSLRPSLKGSSRGKFKLRLFRTTLGGLIDPEDVVELHFRAAGLPDAAGAVGLTAGRYRLGRIRGTLVTPEFFPSRAKITTSDEGPDSVSVRGGFATDGAVPDALGDVEIGIGDDFFRSIPGSDFTRVGDTFRVLEVDGDEMFFLQLDFARELLTLRSKGVEVGELDDAEIDLVVDVGVGPGAVRATVRLGASGAKRFY